MTKRAHSIGQVMAVQAPLVTATRRMAWYLLTSLTGVCPYEKTGARPCDPAPGRPPGRRGSARGKEEKRLDAAWRPRELQGLDEHLLVRRRGRGRRRERLTGEQDPGLAVALRAARQLMLRIYGDEDVARGHVGPPGGAVGHGRGLAVAVDLEQAVAAVGDVGGGHAGHQREGRRRGLGHADAVNLRRGHVERRDVALGDGRPGDVLEDCKNALGIFTVNALPDHVRSLFRVVTANP